MEINLDYKLNDKDFEKIAEKVDNKHIAFDNIYILDKKDE